MPPRWPWSRPQPGPADNPRPPRSRPSIRPEPVTRPQPSSRPRPPAGTLEPIDRAPVAPAPASRPRAAVPPPAPPVPPPSALPAQPVPPPPPAPDPPAPRDDPAFRTQPVYVRFGTAWAALVFAGQLPDDQPLSALDCQRGGPGDGWWVRAELPLAAAREMAAVTAGAVYLPGTAGGTQAGQDLLRDREWGEPDPAQAVASSALRVVPVLDLVRSAGLRPCPPRRLTEAALLVPGYLVAGITLRALDLGLEVSYRPVELRPLFDQAGDARVGYQLDLRTEDGAPLPGFLLAALERDPFVMVCRRAGEGALIGHQLAAPLPDRALAALAGGETWVFAEAAQGCARLRSLGDAQDGTSLVRRGAARELTDISADPGWTFPGEPAGPDVALAATSMGRQVDAALLLDADLECLPGLLAGEPLADAALLIPGRDRHLLTAPGGLLEELPVGEPLYCLGPGSLYLPLGYRLRPALPPAARERLFPVDAESAIVLLPDAALRFDLSAANRRPVWELWAGRPPEFDDQLPAEAVAELDALDSKPTSEDPHSEASLQLGEFQRPEDRAGLALKPGTAAPRGGEERARTPVAWRDQAYEAELAGDLVRAAELHMQHNDVLRAARLYERAAERS